jgi:indole-3-glycerol phosphate synthase
MVASRSVMWDLRDWVEARRREAGRVAMLDARRVTPSVRDLGAALRTGRRDLVAIPFVAPSDESDARAVAAAAAAADVAAMAVATSAPGPGPWKGSGLAAARAASDALPSTPFLRLDPATSEGQVLESRLAGADGVALPVGFLDPAELRRLAKAARSTLMTPVFLVRTAEEVASAGEAEARFLIVAADGGLEATLALAASVPVQLSVCLWAPGLDRPEAVRAIAGRADGAILDPAYPPARWGEVAVVEPAG